MTVSEQIIQVLDNLCAKMGIVIDWTSENVIPYVTALCEKLVVYEIAMSVAQIIISLLVIIGILITIKKLYPTIKTGVQKDCQSYTLGWILTALFGAFVAGAFLFFSVCNIEAEVFDIIKCLTFPEMYVFEYVSSLMPK